MANEIINTGFVTDITTPENSAITVSTDATDPGKYTIGLTSDEVNLDGNSQATGTPKRIKSKFILRSTTKDEGSNVTPSVNEPIVIWDNNNKAQIAIGDGATTAANLSLIGHVPLANGDTAGTVKAGGDITIADGIVSIIDDSHEHNTQYYPQSDIDRMLADKVDVETGKGLSEKDFTNDLLEKLNGIDAGAKVYSAGDGLVLGGTNARTFSLTEIHSEQGIWGGYDGDQSNTFALIPYIKVDKFGRVTEITSDTFCRTSYKFETTGVVDGQETTINPNYYNPTTKMLHLGLLEYIGNTRQTAAIETDIDLSSLSAQIEISPLPPITTTEYIPLLGMNGNKVSHFGEEGIYLIKKESTMLGNQYGITADFFDGITYWGQIDGRPNLADVATSGSYNDLTDRPQFAYDSADKALIIYPK